MQKKRVFIKRRPLVWLELGFLCVLVFAIVMITTAVYLRSNPQEPAEAHVYDQDDPTWATNGTVSTMTQQGNTLYLGGSFTYVGPNTGYGATVDTTSGLVQSSPYQLINDVVRTSISDGSGGFYVGGDFTTVRGETRLGLAHILADGSLDPSFNPDPDSSVTSLALSGTTLYVGGFFSSIGGQARNYIAAIDTTTGLATSFDPNASDLVHSLALSGTTLYAGGDFTSIGGQSRNHAAALDTTTGLATAFDPNVNGVVQALALSGTTLYAGGGFSSAGAAVRNNIAALDTTTGLATAFDPNADAQINSLALSGTTVYVGGAFTTIGGEVRNNIAALDTTTGLATAFNPTSDGVILALMLSDTTLYVGGAFTTIGGEVRNNIAALDTTTGLATAFNPNASGTVYAMALSGTSLYVGGEFVSVGGVDRNYIAALDMTSGLATPFDPNADADVLTMVLSDSTLYVGGVFTSIGGAARNRIAALDADPLSPTYGQANAFDPGADSDLNSLVLSNDGETLFAGGYFTSIGGQARTYIGALDADPLSPTYGQANAFDPSPDNAVYNLALSGTTLYAGGDFLSIGGAARNRIAALDADPLSPTYGQATAFDPNADAAINVMTFSGDGSVLYVGGDFTSIGGQARNSIGALDADPLSPTYGQATAFNPDAGAVGFVLTLALSDSTLYAGGYFTSIGGATRNRIAALDADPLSPTYGQATAFDPNAGYSVSAFVVSDSALYAGGSFTSMGNFFRGNLARFPFTTAQFSSSTSSFGEESGAGSVPITLNQADPADVMVDYAVTGGTAILGTDYTIAPGPVTISSGDTTDLLPITIIDNTSDAPDKTVEITLSAPSGNAILGSPTVHTLTITDDDTPDTPPAPSNVSFSRIAVDDPIDLAIQLSQEQYPTPGSAEAVVLARQKKVVDAFAVTPYAKLKDAPLLITPETNLDQRVLAEIQRVLGPTTANKTVYLTGGEDALSPAVATALTSAGYDDQVRFAGEDRNDTAARVATAIIQESPTTVTRVFATEDERFIDALSLGGIAANGQGGSVTPILLLDRGDTVINRFAKEFLTTQTEITSLELIGGGAALPLTLEGTIQQELTHITDITRTDGEDRFATNAALQDKYNPTPTVLLFANGQQSTLPGAQSINAESVGGGSAIFSALLASRYAAGLPGALLITETNELPSSITNYLATHEASIQNVIFIGSAALVGQAVEDQVRTLL